MTFDGKRALVTGAGSHGIGRAVVLALADAGCDVAIHYLDQHDAATELRDTLRHNGRRSEIFPTDLGEPAAARALVKDASAALGGLDILVCCAATLSRIPFLDITDADWERVHRVNLHGMFAVSQEAARIMADNGDRGRIIFISSVNQDHPTPELAHYVASKGGVRMLARSMALELAPHGITVNLVAPGTVETDINREALARPDFRSEKLAMIPMNRVAQPPEVASAVLYLASEGAAYVTGSTITIDGGLTL